MIVDSLVKQLTIGEEKARHCKHGANGMLIVLS